MKTQKFLGVLFDLDGTLLDTAPDFEFCLNQLLQEEKESALTSGSIRLAVNDGVLKMLALGFGNGLQKERYEDLEKRFLHYYLTHLGNHSVLFPGIASCLAQLNEHHIPWGIVTNKLEKFSLPLVKKIPDFKEAKIIVSGDTLAFAKPHPAPLQYACEKMNLNPADTLYVGDAQRDMQAAIAAGMPCVLATYGYIAPNEPTKTWGAHYSIDHADHLFKIITC